MSTMPLPIRAGSRGGFTVLELLIASAVIVILLAATTGLLVQSNRAYQVNQTASERQQEIEGAVKILTYDLALAGYRGTTPTAFAANTFAGTSIEIVKGGATAAGSDRLIVRYFEDTGRLFDGDSSCGGPPCTVTYDVDVDENASDVLLLYRREGTSTERGIVQEVNSFLVRQMITRTGEVLPAPDQPWPTAIPQNLAALNVEIVFSDGGTWRFPVGVSNLQALP